jgi:excisionase family DNA binding protein
MSAIHDQGLKLALTPEEVAQELSVSVATVRRMIRRGDLRVVRLGDGPRARVRIPRVALDEFLNPTR